MALARANQEFAEVQENAAPRVVQEFVAVQELAAPRVVQEYVEVLAQSGPRVAQAYVEVMDVAPLAPNEVAPDAMHVDVEMVVTLSVDSTATAPASAHNVKRIIRDVPDATIDPDTGMPDADWQARASWGADVIAEWGRLKVVIGGKDVTFWRDVPTQVLNWSKADPFGDLTADIFFPQVTILEAIPSFFGDPEAGDYRNVDIYQRHPDGTKDKLWEGLVVSFDRGQTGLTANCIGALYQNDLYLRRPKIDLVDFPKDISKILLELMTPYRREARQLRHRPMTMDPPGTVMGIEVVPHGDTNGLLTGYVQELLNLAWVEDGSTKWTISKDVGRKPRLHLKDPDTVHYTIHAAEQGVAVDLHLDLTTAPTTIFGEGSDLDTCAWGNYKYPNYRIGTAPVFTGAPMGVGTSDSRFLAFEREMYDHGWTHFDRSGTYDADEEYWVRLFQEESGITVDGVVGAQTWNACFGVGGVVFTNDPPYVAPLYSKRVVDYFNRAPDGSKAGKNPTFDVNKLRVERYENFGTMITKKEGIRSAKLEVERDWPATWFGTIALEIDPPEKSRFELLEDRNILLRQFQGDDLLLHIAKVDTDWPAQRVTLTVDTRLRDAPTLGALLRRDRDTTDPARRRQVSRFNRANEIRDNKPIWDCENGAGRVPYHAVTGKAWDVVRIPAGRIGSVVNAEFSTTLASRMAVGIFDRPVTANQLKAIGGSDPQHGDPLFFFEYWEQFGDELLIAWGSAEEPGGYSPGRESDDDPLTGVLTDAAEWFFKSTDPPWLWVATWVETGDANNVNYVQGLLQQNNEAT